MGMVGCGERRVVPHEGRFGIYALEPRSGDVALVWSTDERISGLALNAAGDRFAFSRRYGQDSAAAEEICTIDTTGTGLVRLTDNDYLDTYPVWSPDGTRIMFLSWPDSTLDVYVMKADGDSVELRFDSGTHDGDPSWVGTHVAFTTGSRVWLMDEDGTNAVQLTNPPRAGEWGNAVLPFGDYDPRIRPDGQRIVFERLVDDQTVHGNYDLFLVNPDGADETRLTEAGYTQGMANWSHDGQKLVFVVSAIGTTGVYDIWEIAGDGTGAHSITPAYFPNEFLCHSPLYSADDARVYFIGEWYE
jgi:TolB protein